MTRKYRVTSIIPDSKHLELNLTDEQVKELYAQYRRYIYVKRQGKRGRPKANIDFPLVQLLLEQGLSLRQIAKDHRFRCSAWTLQRRMKEERERGKRKGE